MDAKSKLGFKYIPKDPHPISPNGSILAGIMERHALYVANGSDKSSGTITRRRVTKYRTEESVIDIVLFSSNFKENFISLKVDDSKQHILQRIKKTKNGVNIKMSDHNVVETEFNCEIKSETKHEKDEIFNLKNKKCQARFKE